ncbi:IS110 family transposase [Microbulbifer aggregans]|uniref:IS110 family transposase n=1 Tax=Microbulbifer aggregans TaxID=1769779 RepID=UPI001CFD5473|nr:IS110 family transposase [Microbulbifer aggregans]
MAITTLGIDLAKTSFSLVGMDQYGNIKLRKTLRRGQLLAFVAKLPPCLIAMEACGGAHYWGREFQLLGHQVAIIAAKFVEPYRKGSKNDNNDAEAIAEAARRPNIWYVPVKSPEQQAILTLHRVRQGLIKERTALINQLRGLLGEFGLVMPTGRYAAQAQIPHILADTENGLPTLARQLIRNIWHKIQQDNEQILEYDRELAAVVRQDSVAKRLMTIPGVGEQVASAISASVPDPRLFKNCRQFAAWIGLVPRQFSTGGKIRLGRITKRGDKYLRMCLVHGARAVVANLRDKQDHVSCWVRELIARRGYLRAVVALAARNARMIWTLLVKKEDYRAIPYSVS